MDKAQAVDVAIKTGKFMIDNQAYKISIDGLFITQQMQQDLDGRFYVPDYEDLCQVLKELNDYKNQREAKTLFKVGLEEEVISTIARFPYHSERQEIREKLNAYNISQDLQDLQ